MSFELFGRKINKIGVIGSGQIGPDIALHFTKSLCQYKVPIIVKDVVEKAIAAGKDKLEKKINKGVQQGAFKPDEAKAMLENVEFTLDKNRLKDCDLIVEAATERVEIKRAIFAELESLCPNNAIFASNSSHLEPEVIFANMKNKSNCLCAHYFFPAERNRMIEIIPSEMTSQTAVDFLMNLYESMGKFPIKVRSRYGYAIDPIFEGLFLAAALCVQEGIATSKQVDSIACKVLGLGVGPFTAMNLTGGNPITQEGLNLLNTKVMRWFKSPTILDDRILSGKPWDVPQKGEEITYSNEIFKTVSENFLGAYFGLVTEVLNSGIVYPGDLEMGCEAALVMKPPLKLMNETGIKRSLQLVENYADRHDEFVVPGILRKQAERNEQWEIPYVRREDRENVSILTIKRPAVLNALNKDVISQLHKHILNIKDESSIKAVVITGYGTKAFVSGAEIGMLASIKTSEEAERTCEHFQNALILIENLGKPVICALNGLAFGGGSELSLACSARVARNGIRTLFAQPEPKLGIIPGAGGTQRLPRIIGFERAWTMLRTGNPISSVQAKEWGLVDHLVEGDIVSASVKFALDIVKKKVMLKPIPRGPVSVGMLPNVDIGGLSGKIDSILQRAILEGARLPLEDGLKLEAKLFGECVDTKDYHIGLTNFLETNLKQPAKFVHE
ncbi:MAG: 3-hydroxyacyl-CoA dehydrogenase/enoyl-CoA hydratase family protein [Planctomycetes bacterium]|nr:3-hydroxyacyl-CoA dehydrogenase/enoyl-CoA hydratase family protein [Planctomycetota bacterium]